MLVVFVIVNADADPPASTIGRLLDRCEEVIELLSKIGDPLVEPLANLSDLTDIKRIALDEPLDATKFFGRIAAVEGDSRR